MRRALSAALLLSAIFTTTAAQGPFQPSGFAVENAVLRLIDAQRITPPLAPPPPRP